jgi:hypothetical protein
MKTRLRLAVVALAAVLSTAGFAQAQEVVTATLVTIQQTQRDAQTIITPSVERVQIPAIEGEYLRVQLTMATADVQNPALTWNLQLEEFIPTVGWKFVTGGPFRGGVRTDPETGLQVFPNLLFHPSQLNPDATDVRFQISIPVRMRIGALVETVRP